MFHVKHNECVGFESRWKVKKVSSVASTQTSEYSTTDMDTNTCEKKDIEVQTDAHPTPTSCEVDEEKLAAWLKKIYPAVKKELDDIANCKAFRGYRLSSDSSDANCKLVQLIDVAKHAKDPDIGCYVSALSWNSTNQTLAVSCTYKHNSWCYHEGLVAVYTLDRDDNLPEAPRIKLTAESCVTVLEFHAVLPAVIAAGLFSGDIIIWNIQKDEEQVVAKVDGHADGITQVSWIADINAPKTYLLASSGLDGFLTLWDFSHAAALTLKEKHQIRSPILPKSAGETIKKVIRGVTCFDFSRHNPEIFVVGAEGGLVVQCSLLGARKLDLPKEAGGALLDSIFKYYEPHKAEVSSVGFSPNRKDMFLTSSCDSEIRIYMVGQEEPARVIFSKNALSCVRWVPFEERIVCGCGKSGLVDIFQLVPGKLVNNTTKDKVKIQTQTQIQVNRMKTNIVATGTENGQIQMWRVPWALFGNMSA